METIKDIEKVLADNLPASKYTLVREGRTFDGSPTIEIIIARDNIARNGVNLQYSEIVTLWINNWKLAFQGFGWQWGRWVYRNIDKNNPDERYYALQHENLPAIRIKDNKRALAKVCKDYISITEDIAKRGLTH